MITVIHEQLETQLPNVQAHARTHHDGLWLDAQEVEQTTGWLWKPEGLCQGELCVPLPRGAEQDLMHNQQIKLSAMWQYMGQPVLHGNTEAGVATVPVDDNRGQRGVGINLCRAIERETAGRMDHVRGVRDAGLGEGERVRRKVSGRITSPC